MATKYKRTRESWDSRGVSRIGPGFGIGASAPSITAKTYGANILSLLSVAYDLGGEEELTRPYEQNSWVHAGIKVLAEAVSGTNLVIRASDDDDADEVPETDPIVRLFKMPNPQMSRATMLTAGMIHRKLDGEDFWFLADRMGRPLEVTDGKIPTPERIMPVRGRIVKAVYKDVGENGTKAKQHIGWTYELGSGLPSQTFPVESVVHFRDYDPINRFRGLGDVETIARALTLQWQAERYQEGLLRNSGDPGGFIETTESLHYEEKERLEQNVQEEFGNPMNRGEWKVLGKGQKYVPHNVKPKDMEFHTLLQHERDVILAVLGVPPPLVGVYDNATFNNITEAKRQLWTGGNGVIAYMRTVEDTINAFLFSKLKDTKQAGYVARFDLSTIEALRDDTGDKLKAAAEMVARGIGLSPNEAFALNGVETDEIENGDVHYQTPGLMVVGEGAVDAGESGVAGESTDGDADAASTAPTGEGEIAEGGLSLNGSQIASVTNIALAVADGSLPRDSGVGLLVELFGVTEDVANAMLGSAGTGEATKPNKPEGGGSPDGEVPSTDGDSDDGSVDDPPDFGESLSFAELAELRSTDTEAWREAYWKRIEKAVLRPGETAMRKATKKYLRSYLDAQIKRLRAVAGGAKNIGRSSEVFDYQYKATTPSAVAEALLLDAEEWIAKMVKAVGPKLAASFSLALRDALADVGGLQVPITDPRVMASLAAQEIKLTEGVNSTLAKKVKLTLVKALSTADDVNFGSVHSAVESILPELEGSLKAAFTDTNSRALAIARTETGQAANTARYIHMVKNDVEEHEWVSARDGVVRESHQAPHGDGEKVKLGEKFPNGLRYPNDPAAPAAEVVNCRCVTAAVIKVPESTEDQG